MFRRKKRPDYDLIERLEKELDVDSGSSGRGLTLDMVDYAFEVAQRRPRMPENIKSNPQLAQLWKEQFGA